MLLDGIISKCKDSLQQKYPLVLGVFWQEQALYLAGIRCQSGEWEIGFAERIILTEEADVSWLCQAAEQVHSCCMREGLEKYAVVLCIHAQQLFCYEKQFPAMTAVELSSAVRWDIEANVPFEEGSYQYIFRPSAGEETLWLGAMEASRVQDIADAFAKNGVSLLAVTAWPELPGLEAEAGGILWGSREFRIGPRAQRMIWDDSALLALAAAGSISGEHANLLPAAQHPERWLWRKLGLGFFVVVLSLCFVVYGVNAWKLHQLSERTRQQDQQMALLRNEFNRKDGIEDKLQQIQAKTQVITDLSKDMVPWHSLLVHFGTLTTEGVWLSDMSLHEPHILLIKGKAVSYDAMAGFLKKFEENQEFFENGPALRDSGLDASTGWILFSFQLKL